MPSQRWLCYLLSVACLCAGGSAWAESGIYSCMDAAGRRLTSDRPIPECLDREQRLLNKDGSQLRIIPPRMNAEERQHAEERRRQQALQDLAAKDAVRRDRNLLMRFPNESAHNKARTAALDDLHRAIQSSERQLSLLQTERKAIHAEMASLAGKPVPLRLRAQIDANEAQQHAQHDIVAQQQAELVRVNALYDKELARLKLLWRGAPLGSEAPEGGAALSVPQ